MSVLPKNTALGKLEIIEVFEYYDQPVLFACQNAAGSLYLAVLEDEDEDFESWLYAPMSPERFAQVRSGGVDLYSAFRNAEDGFVFRVTRHWADPSAPNVDVIPVDQLTEEQLPEAGETLDLETATLERREISIQQRASQILREYVELSLELPGQRRTEAPILVLSNIMRHLQTTLISIGHTISDRYKTSTSPTSEIREKLELSLLDVSAGSFTLEMASSQSSDMFGDTLLGDALEELARLIETESSEPELEAIFKDYKPSVPKDYLKLLRAIRSSRIDRANIRWASANGQRVGQATFTSPNVFAAIDTIEQMSIQETNIITVVGSLTGAYTNRAFEIETGDKRFSGKFDADALSDEAIYIINNARLGRRYKAQLREVITTRIASDEITTRYYLIDVEEDPLFSR